MIPTTVTRCTRSRQRSARSDLSACAIAVGVKASKTRRKQLNALRAEGDVPWPARRYKIPPTFAQGAKKSFHVGTCEEPVGETQVKKGRLRRTQTETIPCNGRLIARLGKGARRRVYCESCRERNRQVEKTRRLERRASRLGFLTPREEARQSRRASFLSKIRRRGSR